MALITCPECGKQISDKAPHCVHCGAPMASQSSTVHQRPSQPMPMQQRTVQPAQYQTTSKLSVTVNSVKDKAKLYAGQIKSYIVNYKIYPPATRRKILITGGAVVVCFIAFFAFLISQFSLKKKKKHVLEVTRSYRSMLKDPDSMIIRGDIIFIETEDYVRYVCFEVSGNNSFGASVTSMPIYKWYSYLGRYDDEPDDDDKMDLLKARVYVAEWNLTQAVQPRKKIENYSGNKDGMFISGKKIARRLHCKYVDP